MREWSNGPYTLHLWDTGRTKPHNGASILAYKFWHDGALIFEGSDFAPSPLHAIDSDAAMYALLGFLALRPGETDATYFASYTPEQLAFVSAHADDLSLLVYAFENYTPQQRALAEHLGEGSAEGLGRTRPDALFGYGVTIEYGRATYAVLTDDEADGACDNALDAYLDECILPELPELAQQYFDRDAWKADAMHDGRGHWLAGYDSNEDEAVDPATGTRFYIYRIN